MAEERVLLTINEVTMKLKVSRRTVYNWLQLDRLDFVRTPGGSIRIYEDSLMKPQRKNAPGT